MNDKEQSALDIFYNSLNHYDKQVYELNYLQAKELEKQQKIDCLMTFMNTDGITNEKELAEQYYNDKYLND